MKNGMLGNNEVLRRIWDGPLADLVQKLNGSNGPEVEAALKELLRQKHEKSVPPGFQIRQGVICGSVVCEGYSGESSLQYLSQSGYMLAGRAFQMLAGFIPENRKRRMIPFAVIGLGDIPKGERTNEWIRREACRRGFRTPPLELAPLLRAKLSDEEISKMGVAGLTVMCKPAKIPFDGNENALWLPWIGSSVHGSEMSAHSGSPGHPYNGVEGFVFLPPEGIERELTILHELQEKA